MAYSTEFSTWAEALTAAKTRYRELIETKAEYAVGGGQLRVIERDLDALRKEIEWMEKQVRVETNGRNSRNYAGLGTRPV